MEFLKDSTDYQELGRMWERYMAYLVSVREKLAPQVYAFATTAAHYDPQDPRTLHDARLIRAVIREGKPPLSDHARAVTIDLTLERPYGDGELCLRYVGVHGYSLTRSTRNESVGAPHGDLVRHEIRVSERGYAIHEIVFSSGADWTIEFENLEGVS
jgi:hypothetical protein